jgi:hypothetical protein
MDRNLDQIVRSRARHCCEYCRFPQRASKLTFPLDHIVARQHGGSTVEENLALCCGRCNQHKGPNIAGIDPINRTLTRLFHPRKDGWDDHFHWEGALIIGATDVGRTTVAVLNLNHSYSVAARETLMEKGLFFS